MQMEEQRKATEEAAKRAIDELKAKAAALQEANDELKNLREELKNRDSLLSTYTLNLCSLCKEYDDLEQKLYPTDYWSQTEKLEGLHKFLGFIVSYFD